MPAIVRELGTVAGLAGLVGLTVLSALHLAQARDVARLRAWAGRTPDRAGRPTASPRRARRIGVRQVAVALVGVLVLGGTVTYGVAGLTGGDDDGGRPVASAPARHHPQPKRAVVQPGDVTVAVLNGTTVPGLAAALRERLAAAGFRKGLIGVFPGQQVAESVVQYAPGQKAAAEAVGTRLGIGRRTPVTADARALAGDATVIVIAGADQAP